ncbi:MAG: tail fiber domain-containing protein [Bacteroidales bacterium]
MKLIYFFLILVLAVSVQSGYTQVAISNTNATPDPSAMLDIQSDNKGILIPRIALLGTNSGVVPFAVNSLLIFNTATSNDVTPGFYYWNGSSWTRLAIGGATGETWTLGGNTGTDPASAFLGTTDNVPLVFRVNNLPAGKIDGVVNTVSLGSGSGMLNTGMNNTFIGDSAGRNNTIGAENVYLGYRSGLNQQQGFANTFVGSNAGVLGSGQDNTFLGYYSGANSAGSNSVAVGFLAGMANTGSENVFVGSGSGQFNAALGNTFVGCMAGNANNTGSGNAFFGNQSGTSNNVGSNNAFFGFQAGMHQDTAFYSSFFGYQAGKNTRYSGNSFYGALAGLQNVDGRENSFFGMESGQLNNSSLNSFFGTRSGKFTNLGGGNAFFGYESGLSNTMGTENAYFGKNAGTFGTTASFNTFLGNTAGHLNATGENNTFVGYITGQTNETGNNNTLLGAEADLSLPNLTNATAIGAFAQSDISNSVILGSVAGVNGATSNVNVGIGTNSPAERLDVAGKTKTTNFQMTNGAGAGKVIQGDAAGNASWVNSTSLSITETDPQVSSSVSGLVPKWNGSTLTDGIIRDDGTNVGIGKTPAEKLDVNGKIKTTTLQMTTGATNGFVLQSDALGNGTWVNSTALQVTENDPQVSSSVAGLVPKWNGSALTDGIIRDDGTNIGIGKIPAEKLDVNGKTKTTFLQMTTGAANGFVLQSDALGNGVWVNSTSLPVTENDPQVSAISINKIPKWNGTSLVDGVIFDNGANIGIGTTNPAARVDARSTNTTPALFAESIGGWTIQANSFLTGGRSLAAITDGGTAVYAEGNGVGIAKLASTADNAVGYFSGGNVLVQNGLVGIGTTNPSAKLDVRSTNTSTAVFAESVGGWTIHANSYLAGGRSIAALTDGGTAVYAEGNAVGVAKLASTADNAAGYFSGNVLMVNGSVGIGTTTPDTKLEIAGSGVIGARLTTSTSSDVNFDFKRVGSDWRIRNSTGLLFIGQSADDLATVSDVLRLGGASVTPAADNAVTLGNSSLRWTQVFAVNGTISTSDARLKRNISAANYGLDAIMKLKPVSFTWKNDMIDQGKNHIGLLAQEVQKIIPEAVVDHEWKETPDGHNRVWTETENLGINYAELTPVLVKAIQEQQVVIEQLRLEIENLKRSTGMQGR